MYNARAKPPVHEMPVPVSISLSWAGHGFGRSKISGLVGVGGQTGAWAKFACWSGQSSGLTVQCKLNEINGTIEVKNARINDEVIQVGIV